MSPGESGVHIHVHEGGDRSLDGILGLIDLAGRDQALEETLRAMCGHVAAIARADVASVYVRERTPDGEVFVMRGNVGFPADAVGRVHLRPGEGITGFVADRLRPVSVAMADRDAHFKYIPGLGEERFPALLAVPVLRAGAAAGVLVLQRREASSFNREEVALATALAAVINHALERAEERAWAHDAKGRSGAVRLRGVGLVGGAAMGRAEVLPTLAALARGVDEAPASNGTTLDVAVERLRSDLRKALGTSPALPAVAMVLEDRRFRDRLAAACGAPEPLPALSTLARDYARGAYRRSSDADGEALLAERAGEIEDLCVLVYTAMRDRPLGRAGSIMVADRLGAFMALCAVGRGACGFVVEGAVAPDAAAVAILRAAGVPLVTGTSGIFSWVRPGDLVVLDADLGSVRLNPPATAVARFRRSR